MHIPQLIRKFISFKHSECSCQIKFVINLSFIHFTSFEYYKTKKWMENKMKQQISSAILHWFTVLRKTWRGRGRVKWMEVTAQKLCFWHPSTLQTLWIIFHFLNYIPYSPIPPNALCYPMYTCHLPPNPSVHPIIILCTLTKTDLWG